MIYLDHAATTPMRPGVREAMEPFLAGEFGNPSGVHEVSRRAKNALEDARERIGYLIGASPMEVVFTSGGTESDNLALKGPTLHRGRRTGVVTVATEHDAVLETAAYLNRVGIPVTVVGVDRNGLPGEIRTDDRTGVVSVMWANSETGVLADVPTLAGQIKSENPAVLFHTDAIQAFNTEPVTVEAVDLMSLSAHKIGGPKGIGVLYVREGTALEPVIHGGGHELGRRSGTQNVAGAVGMAEAMELAVADRDRLRNSGLCDDLEKRLTSALDGVVVNGGDAPRTGQHLNIRFEGVRNQDLLMRLDRAGVAASAGSACQSGAAKVSHVLEAMGLTPDEARQSVRLSLGWNTTADDVITSADTIVELVEELR